MMVQDPIPITESAGSALQRQQGQSLGPTFEPLQAAQAEGSASTIAENTANVATRVEQETGGPAVQGTVPCENPSSNGTSTQGWAHMMSNGASRRDCISQYLAARLPAGTTSSAPGPHRHSSEEHIPASNDIIPLFVFGSRSSDTAENPTHDQETTTRREQEQPACYPNCSRTFATKRGMANQLRRGTNNPCGELHAETINHQQNVPTPSNPSTTKRRRGQRIEGHDEGRTSQTASPRSPKMKQHRKHPPLSFPYPPWAGHPPAATPPTTEDKEATPTPQQDLQPPTEHTSQALQINNTPDAKEQSNEPISRLILLRIPRLSPDSRARLEQTPEARAKETAEKVNGGTSEEVEAAMNGFTQQLYNAIWFADKTSSAAK